MLPREQRRRPQEKTAHERINGHLPPGTRRLRGPSPAPPKQEGQNTKEQPGLKIDSEGHQEGDRGMYPRAQSRIVHDGSREIP